MQNNQKTYFYRIDFYRLIFTIFVVMLHFETFYPISVQFSNYAKSLYRSVDFFFVLSGFLLFQSFSKRRYENALDYTVSKIKRFLPLNIVVIIITCFFVSSEPITSLSNLLAFLKSFSANFVNTIPNMFFLQLFIPVYEKFFPTQADWFLPLWYISALITGCFLWFQILLVLQKKNEKAKNTKYFSLSLFVAIFIFSFLVYEFGNLNISQTASSLAYIPSGFLRGFAEMGLGIFCANYKFEIKNKKLISISKIIVPLILFTCIFYAKQTTVDFIYVFIISIALIFEFSLDEEIRLPVKKLSQFASKASLAIYFTHAVVIVFEYTWIIQNFPFLRKNPFIDILVRIILLSLTAFISFMLSKPVSKLLNKLYSCIKYSEIEVIE